MAIVPFPGYQLAVPAQDGVGCDDGTDLSEQSSSKDLAFDGQTAPLIVGESDASVAVRFLQNLVLSAQVFDDRLLLAVDPARMVTRRCQGCRMNSMSAPGVDGKEGQDGAGGWICQLVSNAEAMMES